MNKILKGADSEEISFALADGFDYAGATVEVLYQGARRLFSGIAAGDILKVRFSAAETSAMVLGAWPVVVRVKTAAGGFFTVPTGGVRIAVTDVADEVCPGGAVAVTVHGGLHGVEGLPDRYTDEDLRAKIDEIISRLGGGR